MERGDKEASTREKFEAVFPELMKLTDASSRASGVEKPKKKKRVKKRKNHQTAKINPKLKTRD